MRKILLATLVFAMSAWALDLNGRWWGEAVIDNGSFQVHLNLVQQGNTLKGSGGPTPSDQDVLTNGRIEGKKVTFDIVPGNRMPLHFELSADEWTLKGIIKIRRNGQMVTGQVLLRKRTN